MHSLETSVTHRRADIIDTMKLATVKWTWSVPLVTVARNVCLILEELSAVGCIKDREGDVKRY